MTAQIIQFVPRPNPARKSLEEQAIEIVNIALMDNDSVIYESSLGYLAPEKDPA